MSAPSPDSATNALQSNAVMQGLRGTLRIPGDKSISHRALMLSSQVLGDTTITNLLEGEDVIATAKALRKLGVRIEHRAPRQWHVQGVGVGGLQAPVDVLDMGNAGTGARLMMGLLAPYPFASLFTGDASLRSRPMARVMKPLQEMGAQFWAYDGNRLPLAMMGCPQPVPITYRLPVASAQVKSAIILAGLHTPGRTTVIEPTPSRDHTENMLRYFGFPLQVETLDDAATAIHITGEANIPFAERDIAVPADPSSAAFAIVAALITRNSELHCPDVCINPLRTGLFTTLQEMGATLEIRNERMVCGERVADITARSSDLRGVRVPAVRAPSMIDEYPILAVAAACAQGETVMEGLGELRVKESDRFNAILQGLQACGVATQAQGDTLIVHGVGHGKQVPGGAMIDTRMDHRIAMAFLVLGMSAKLAVNIDDETPIATSFPGFVGMFQCVGARISPLPVASAMPQKPANLKPLVIAIDGPAASGKGTLARRLAEYLGCDYLDTGSLYRTVGLKLVYGGLDPHDEAAALQAAKSVEARDFMNPRLRQERIGQAASIVSEMPSVRAALLEFQQQFARREGGAILDGRDIGTVVCPSADIKLFLTADLQARARRRHRELQGQGIEVVYESVLEDLRERDERDQARAIAPLMPAKDAITLDTSALEADDVFNTVRDLILKKFAPNRYSNESDKGTFSSP